MSDLTINCLRAFAVQDEELFVRSAHGRLAVFHQRSEANSYVAQYRTSHEFVAPVVREVAVILVTDLEAIAAQPRIFRVLDSDDETPSPRARTGPPLERPAMGEVAESGPTIRARGPTFGTGWLGVAGRAAFVIGFALVASRALLWVIGG